MLKFSSLADDWFNVTKHLNIFIIISTYISYLGYMLTEKEIEVLKLKKQGLTQLEIAKKLKISQPAVSSFYNNALTKIQDAEEILKIKKELGVKNGK
jgi:DNA-binding NarL/FixJ family response regulator